MAVFEVPASYWLMDGLEAARSTNRLPSSAAWSHDRVRLLGRTALINHQSYFSVVCGPNICLQFPLRRFV